MIDSYFEFLSVYCKSDVIENFLQMSKEQALRRWNILADVIKSKNCKTEVDGSKRSFQSYNIVRVEPIEDETDDNSDSCWKMVSFKDISVAVR